MGFLGSYSNPDSCELKCDANQYPLVTYIDRLPRGMGAYCAKDAFSRLGARLVANSEWQKWWVKNSALFATSTAT